MYIYLLKELRWEVEDIGVEEKKQKLVTAGQIHFLMILAVILEGFLMYFPMRFY